MDDCKNADDLLAEIQLEDPNYQPSTKIHPIRPVADLHNIKPLEFDEIESDNPPAIEYILHPVLPAQGICFIYAASGLGKTLFTLNLAYAIAGGGSFLKYNCQIPRKVLYVDGEMPYKQLHARLMEIPKHQGILDYKKNLAFLTPDKIMPTRIPKIDELLGQQFYEQFIELYQYEVIIFDNLSMLSSIDESKSSEWKIIQDWLLYLRAIGKTVIIIHHAGKDKSGYRGTSRMLDCADTAISLQSLIDDEPKAKAVDLEESAVPTTMMGMVTPPPSAEDSEKFKWLCAQENVKDLTGVIGKLVDAFVANQLFKDNIAQAVDKVKDSEKPETIVEYKEDLGKEAKDPTGKVKDVELDPGKAPKKEILQKPYVSDAQRRFFHSSGAKKAGLTAKDVKHWDEASKGKKLPEKVAKLEPPSGAASPHMPKQPQGAAPMVKPSHNPQAAQNKQGQVTFKQKFGKLAKPKAPANYFQNKLANVAKSEFHVTTEQLYQPCVQCGTAEFVKNEDGMPHYSPCACFGVTLQSSSGKKTTFVELKKSGAGYSLKFSNKADQDTIKAFLLTLRTRLKK